MKIDVSNVSSESKFDARNEKDDIDGKDLGNPHRLCNVYSSLYISLMLPLDAYTRQY